MRTQVLQTVVLSLMLHGLSGCATVPESAVTNDSILADARARSATYCVEFKEGCELTIRRVEDGWTARVIPVVRDASGKRVYGLDLDDFYIYDRRGRFESALWNYR